MSYLYLDIETVPDEGRKDLWGLAEPVAETIHPDEFVAWSVSDITTYLRNYGAAVPKDWLGGIKAAEASGKSRAGVFKAIEIALESEAKMLKELSTDPERCKIVAIGYARDDEDPDVAYPSPDAMSEEEMLRWFWNNVLHKAGQTFIGYNILGFDLPVICARSIMLGVKPTISIDWRKYGNLRVIDLMTARFPHGKAKSLKTLAEYYKIDVPCPDVDGSMVHKMTPEQVAEYVKSDVIVTRELHRRFAGFFCPPIIEYEGDLF